MKRLAGQRALVTGASSGIGQEIARKLAAEGASVILTARRLDRLETLAEQLRTEHGVTVEALQSDLEDPAAPQQLFDATEGAGKAVDVLVNCAGFAFYDDFVRIDWLKHQRMLQVNVIALTHLSHLFAKAMIPRKRGRIMNIASTGAFAPCPNFASYAASKAYVRNLTEALDYELRNTGVRAISVSPGGTRTEFLERGGQVLKKSGEFAMMTAEACAAIAVDKMLRGRRSVVTGFMNAFSVWMLRFIPRAWLPRVIELSMSSAVEKAPPASGA
ncbi:MAG: SDR family oxidoreductase [Sandaracinaceae bacterium]|jgi:short-subunit dehydrogenase|nr:SDR family oxidoreductase [Sandaracinaceae bacterium]MBP7684533.1 SDR family oxidoreductase [Deltaproteobacteria bacterium]MBK6809332.1 SDR family oxidoreductase [Sandaracinaceae bacterium]MBK7151323.1 SDR family oxidoreductase [Sandaracinaceae bacterium]MBK7778056.1 SDR family oxidoreductase [Sandaracinaceae bacterium]